MVMDREMSQRHLLGVMAGIVVGAVTISRPDDAAALENCYYRKERGPYCDPDGNLVEVWAYRCCAGTTCWVEWRETRVVGTC